MLSLDSGATSMKLTEEALERIIKEELKLSEATKISKKIRVAPGDTILIGFEATSEEPA